MSIVPFKSTPLCKKISLSEDFLFWRDEYTLSPAAAKPANRALNYRQRQYSAEELKKMGVDLGEDVYETGESK